MPEQFEAQLTVDKSIVELLSKSTYQRNFSHALREMVSNAYDADATKVTIDINDKVNQISIRDDGHGMTREEFGYYLRIAGRKRGRQHTERFQRKRIGQFGVGFLSVFPFCEALEVATTIEGSDEMLIAVIPAAQYMKVSSKPVDVNELQVTGLIFKDASQRRNHHTIVTLKNLTHAAQRAVSRQLSSSTNDASVSRARTASIQDWRPLDRLKWELQEELPLPFPPESAYVKHLGQPEALSMDVFLNQERLLRNDVMGDVLDSGSLKLNGIMAKYVISTPWKAIKPYEMRHAKLRLNNVGVGPRTDFDISRTRPFSRLHWISAEVHISEGMDEFVSVSRDSFIDTPEYESLKDTMAKIMRRQAQHVEDVEENRTTITKQLGTTKQKKVASKRDVVDKSIDKLVSRGFTLEKVSRKTAQDAAVSVDQKKKTIIVVDDHPDFADEIIIERRSYRLKYENFSETGRPRETPCTIDGKTIVINLQYPLFKSKRYGEVFKRILALCAVAEERCASAQQMHAFIRGEMCKILGDYM